MRFIMAFSQNSEDIKYIDFLRSLSGFSKALCTAFSNDILIFAI